MTDEGHKSEISFHDSELTGVAIPQPKEIRLTFKLLDGKMANVCLQGIRYFKCDNFLEGNIVFDFEEVPPDGIAPSDYSALLLIEDGAQPEFLQRLKEELAEGSLKFFRLESSYGAEIRVLCKDAIIERPK